MVLTVSKAELLKNSDDLYFRQVIHNTLGFCTRLLEIRYQMAKVIDLSGTTFSVLLSIEHLSQKNTIGITQISEHLSLSGAFVTLEVNRLVKKKLVKKITNPEDKRRVILTITNKAKKTLEELSNIQSPVNDTIFDKFNSEEFNNFAKMINKLLKSTDESLKLLSLLIEKQNNK